MKLVFFMGKGGTGKSTLAAAAGWQLSRHKRVLIVSLDPAHNLGDIFGIRLNSKPHRFDRNLCLRELDLPRLSRIYLQREIDVLSEAYKYVQVLNLDKYFSILKYSPGLEEYTLLASLDEIVRDESGWDYVVFDTPPTGLTLRFLALPRLTLTWLERLIEIRRLILKKRHTIRRIQGGSGADPPSGGTVLRYDEREDRVFTRLLALEEKYRRLNETLQGRQCSYAVAFNPDQLSYKESERLIEGLRELQLPLRLLIHNKYRADGDAGAQRALKIEEKVQQLASGVRMERVAYADSLHEGGKGGLYRIPENIGAFLEA